MNQWNPEANEILLTAVAIEDPAEQKRFVDATCAENDELRLQVRSLLHAYHASGQFLAGGAATSFNNNRETEPHCGHPNIPAIFLPGKRFANQFIIREVIGWGGMGIVALADQIEPIARQVAIKINRPDYTSNGLLARFEQERRVLALMEHPHIAKVLQAGYVDLATGNAIDVFDGQPSSHPYLIMEYIDGEPIQLFCDAQRQTVEQRVGLIIDVCHAVQHAHSKGIIHRDLKPSNILIEIIDGRPNPKIIDFGVAKPFESAEFEESLHTGDHHLVGTIDYMSPEQACFSSDIDTRTDVYSLGAVLYELLTGSVPLVRNDSQKDDLLETMRLIQRVDPHRPSVRLSETLDQDKAATARGATIHQLIRSVKGDADWITMRALEKDPQLRYQTAGQFADDLQRFLNDEPVSARAPSFSYRLAKSYRRHRLTWLACMAMLLLLVTGTIGTTIGLYRASRNASQALAGQKRVGQLLSQSYLEAAKAAEQRGQWFDAIKNLDRIKSFDYVDLFDVQLIRVAALNGLNRLDGVRKILAQLETLSATDSQLGQLRLWQADIALLDGEMDRHQQLVREAISHGLPSGDKRYACCLIAQKTPEAIEQLEKALIDDPFHHRAAQTLPILYLSLGRFDDARAQVRMASKLFPNDPVFVASESVILALEGKRESAELFLDQNSRKMTRSQLEEFRTLIKALDQLRHQMGLAVQSPLKSLGKLNFGFSTSQTATEKVFESHALRVPLVVRNNMAASVKAIGATFFGKNYESAAKTLREVSDRHPDGLLFFVSGSLSAVKRKWLDAEKAFRLAVDNPSLIAAVKPKALHSLIMTQCAIHISQPINEQEVAELRALIERRLALAEATSHELGQLSKAAIMARDFDLARSIIQKALDVDPESVTLNVFLAEIEFAIGNVKAANSAAVKSLDLAAKPGLHLFGGNLSKLISTAKRIRDDTAVDSIAID